MQLVSFQKKPPPKNLLDLLINLQNSLACRNLYCIQRKKPEFDQKQLTSPQIKQKLYTYSGLPLYLQSALQARCCYTSQTFVTLHREYVQTRVTLHRALLHFIEISGKLLLHFIDLCYTSQSFLLHFIEIVLHFIEILVSQICPISGALVRCLSRS